jgi:predicted molibdopterin-dependent oxidoreductase YjgC
MPTFSFDGRAVPFEYGQSVAAALTADGVVTLRWTRRRNRPRGLFCGIGVCFDCLVRVDGAANQRACLLPAREGMVVNTQNGTGLDDLDC